MSAQKIWGAIKKVPGKILGLLSDYLQNGGLPYEPEKWNSDYLIQTSTNCYAYAFNLQTNPIKNDRFKTYGEAIWSYETFAMQPGMFSGLECTKETINDPIQLVEIIKKDAEVINFTFKETDIFAPVKEGNWKVALVIAPTDETGNYDYHWYRMNKDHTWSHKRGATEVQQLDATDNIIYDPKFADRNYKPTGGLDYSIFVGYYEVGKCDIDE